MTAFHHPATMPAGTIGTVDRVVHRVDTAMVRWSTRRAERSAARDARVRTHSTATSIAMTPELRRAVLADRTARELAGARAAATLIPHR
ncbi:hypothetical protein [Curtobacterium sp. Leaf261]|uniref:hypothetical protein n=1 Tax=Curtobacterium sp. Leaf261 TaxID=1736311 RepID=UPI000700ABD5|nr:hypothetical protein [Curtobacterium sp. Leaf261]KQO61409.1 hypothetical protein ASF23_13125 [Curtobacterium sp. Leaf261]